MFQKPAVPENGSVFIWLLALLLLPIVPLSIWGNLRKTLIRPSIIRFLSTLISTLALLCGMGAAQAVTPMVAAGQFHNVYLARSQSEVFMSDRNPVC